MFTGIITAVGTIADTRSTPAGRRFAIDSGWDDPDLALGESISIEGACMTVVAADGPRFEVEVSPESLHKTTLGDLVVGDSVNLERALALGDRLGGHFVSGHVDGVGRISSIEAAGDCLKIEFEAPPEVQRYLVPKGSVTVDGISLTVNGVRDEAVGGRFDVMIIPHTKENTSLRRKDVGSAVNLEADVLGKYVERLLAGR
jgi:riboflavin synthase